MNPPLDPGAWAQALRAPMLRFAQLHLQHREDAEDAVQDTLAALLNADTAGTWTEDPKRYAFGILKHKLTDRLRRKYRGEIAYQEAFGDDLDELLFEGNGHWAPAMAPTAWNAPEAQLQSAQFFTVVDLCVDKLPAKPARVFSMKAFLDCEADEICSTLGLSKADYWQCMSRARKQLQLCLHQHWFEGGTR